MFIRWMHPTSHAFKADFCLILFLLIVFVVSKSYHANKLGYMGHFYKFELRRLMSATIYL